jgi:methylase of polypeptide subunit release factors
VDHVIGTDIHPYAVACAKSNLQRFGYPSEIVLADLFPPTTAEEKTRRADLVLFNPPWIPGDAETWLDKAVYDPDQNLLRRFLLQVQHHVNDDGQGYLLLSNLGIVLRIFQESDLYEMFREGNLELVAVHETQSKAERTKTGSIMKARKIPSYRLDGIASIKAQEVVSLYHLRVKR